MTPKTVGLLIGWALLGAAHQSDAAEYPAITLLYDAVDAQKLQFKCTPIAAGSSGRQRIDCDIASTSVLPPKSSAAIEKDIAENARALRAEFAKDSQAFLRDACSAPKPEYPPAYRALREEICTAKSPEPMVRALTERARKVTAHTCKLQVDTWKETLERVDANTWSAAAGPRGACNVMMSLTLWRSPAQPQFWNYKQVRTMPENETGPLCAGYERVSVMTFGWKAPEPRDIGCQFIE